MNRVEDGPSCVGCGLPNYSGLCPWCRANESEWQEMWGYDPEGGPTTEQVHDSRFSEREQGR